MRKSIVKSEPSVSLPKKRKKNKVKKDEGAEGSPRVQIDMKKPSATRSDRSGFNFE